MNHACTELYCRVVFGDLWFSEKQLTYQSVLCHSVFMCISIMCCVMTQLCIICFHFQIAEVENIACLINLGLTTRGVDHEWKVWPDTSGA